MRWGNGHAKSYQTAEWGEGEGGLFTDSELQYIFNILLCICSKLKKRL